MTSERLAELIVARAAEHDGGHGLAFESYRDLAARVDASSTKWLWQQVWPGDAYGVLAAQDKAGKS